MPELRWNPVLQEWVGTAAQRQARTFFPPEDYCPLCPTHPGGFPTEIPRPTYEIAVFQNKFPALVPEPGGAAPSVGDEPYRTAPARGVCEVIVYSPDHHATLADLPEQELRNLVDVWADRYAELGALDFVKYVYIFENKGREIGVTLSHPHGQVYAFPFIPPRPQRELDSAREYWTGHGECLFCAILAREQRESSRLVVKNKFFVAFVPFYARWPYETHVYSRRHASALTDFTSGERAGLADLLKQLLNRFDALWGRSLPYMMLMHQRPSDGADYTFYHYHIEFYPPYRTSDKLKYLAGVESGAGTFLNDTQAEDKARELREARRP